MGERVTRRECQLRSRGIGCDRWGLRLPETAIARDRESGAELSAKPCLQRFYFGVDPAELIFSPIHFQGAGDSVAVVGEFFVTLLDDRHYLRPFAFDAGAQGAEFVGQAALVDDVEAAGHVGADGFAFVHRPDA